MAIGSQSSRAYSAAHFVFELDQTEIAGFFRSVEGGGVKADILTHRTGYANAQWRQLGKPRYEDIKVQVGMSMSSSFYDWIEAFFAGKVVRKNGAILAGDFHFKERARRELYETLISEVTIPKFDAADKQPCYLAVTMVPERIAFAPGSYRDLSSTVGGNRQKLWTPNHFEFTISGFEQATRRTTKIDAFSIKQQVIEYRAGNLRDPIRVPGRIEFPNMTFHIPEADADPIIDYFRRRVINGHPPTATRLDGSLTATDSAHNPLCTISLFGIDIASVGPDKSDASSQDIKHVRVDITVERMSFAYVGGGGDLA